MDSYLINPQIIDVIITSETQFSLSEFLTINTLLGGKTITQTLDDALYSQTSLGRNVHRVIDADTCDIITLNIHKLLMHPEIDYSIVPNLQVLEHAMCVSNSYRLNNATIDTLLAHHKLNPDVIASFRGDRGAIFRLLIANDVDVELLSIFLKHGANTNFRNISWWNHPCILALHNLSTSDPALVHCKLELLDTIVAHTKLFYFLKNIPFSETIYTNKIYNSILRQGKLCALEHSDDPNLKLLDDWLQFIRRQTHMNMRALRKIFNGTIKRLCMVKDSVRKLLLFKHNLECLTQHTITVPAYKYYNIAIILLFLIRNSHLTVLNTRHITLRHRTCVLLNFIFDDHQK